MPRASNKMGLPLELILLGWDYRHERAIYVAIYLFGSQFLLVATTSLQCGTCLALAWNPNISVLNLDPTWWNQNVGRQIFVHFEDKSYKL